MFGPLHCPTLRINLDRVLSAIPGLEKVSLHPEISSLQDGFTLASLAYFPLPLRALSLHDDLWPSLSRERNREKIEVDSPPSLLSPTLPSSSPPRFRSPDFPMYFSCLSVPTLFAIACQRTIATSAPLACWLAGGSHSQELYVILSLTPSPSPS